MDQAADTYVPRLCGAIPEMMTPAFWLRPGDETPLLPPDEVAALSRRLLRQISFSPAFPFPLEDMPETLPGETVRRMIGSFPVPAHPETYFLRGRPTDPAWWRATENAMATDRIPERVSVRFGFCVRRDTVNFWPVDAFLGETPEDVFFNRNTNAECAPLQPLAVLHESRDGEWLFCMLYHMAGWTHRTCVALCPTRADWLRRQRPEQVLYVIGRELRLGDDPLCPALSGLLLPMGTRLPLLRTGEVPPVIRGRSPWGNYTVSLPIRAEDGSVQDALCLIPVSDPVCIGPLPFSRAHILRQAFRRLGDRYGWGGALHANDCSGIIHEIFECFGIRLPRDAIRIQEWGFPPAPGVPLSAQRRPLRLSLSGLSAEEKHAALARTPPGSILYMPGHIVLYLGMWDSRPWVISATGSLCRDGCTAPVMSVCVNDLSVQRKNGRTWLESLETLIQI